MEGLLIVLFIGLAIILGFIEFFTDLYIYSHSKFKTKIDDYFFSTTNIP